MMVGGAPALVPPTSINSPRKLLELAKLLFYLTLLPEKASLVITLYTQVCTYNIPPLPNCIVLVRLLINLLTVHEALEYNANMLYFPATQRLDQKVFNSTCCSYLGWPITKTVSRITTWLHPRCWQVLTTQTHKVLSSIKNGPGLLDTDHYLCSLNVP